jgi:hypothetical protein
MQRVDDAVDAEADVGERLAAGWCEKEAVALASLQLLGKLGLPLAVRHQVEDAEIALAQKRLGVPQGGRQRELGGGLHRAHVLGDVEPVEVRVDVRAQPVACLHRLLDAAVGEPPERRVPPREKGVFVEGVVAAQRALVGDVALALAVPHEHELGQPRQRRHAR